MSVWNYDISSAYPYQCCFLPCLVHGEWRLTKQRKDLERCTAALVHYTLGPISRDRPRPPWGPFPWRDSSGSICFPIESGGGWIYREEYLEGERLFGNVQFLEAWVYETGCTCQPFKDIPRYYRERIKLGKEGAGIVLKLGMNSCYGKLAQSVGKAIFNNWIWAGMITSGTRAQLLTMLGLHKDWANLLMVATDGIYTKERLVAPKPRNTDTWETKKPLGGWEEKEVKKGVFVARPGIYFPLNPTKEELKIVRGRGVGKAVVLQNWERIIESWETHGLNEVAQIANVSRFCGAKSSISRTWSRKKWRYKRANGKGTKPAYGQWVIRPVEMTFYPMPKREKVEKDGVTLRVRVVTGESKPYNNALRSQEAAALQAARDEILEQPDVDLTEYEVENQT